MIIGKVNHLMSSLKRAIVSSITHQPTITMNLLVMGTLGAEYTEGIVKKVVEGGSTLMGANIDLQKKARDNRIY